MIILDDLRKKVFFNIIINLIHIFFASHYLLIELKSLFLLGKFYFVIVSK